MEMNMKVFLTSSPGGNYKDEYGVRIPCKMDAANGFLTNLMRYWPQEARCLVIASDPDNAVANDSLRSIFPESFWMSGLPLQNLEVCDSRNEGEIQKLISDSNVILLAGGHVPTQNAFFHKIRLREHLNGYQGIVIGISAGSMNSAEIVYAQPEETGEAIDPDYERYLRGLGLTRVRILPHFQYLRGLSLDGKRILEDICIPDSSVRSFYALVDGSYLFVDEKNHTTLYGEAYLFRNGSMKMVCEKDEQLTITEKDLDESGF